ncbi:unnamed protein product [Ilex paraguariensis]|uniref:Uncharacterized protein n=1 Tax=Ilex paraguariensis TaxID=185542 RepID=A0ABC8R5Z1_9AQUA
MNKLETIVDSVSLYGTGEVSSRISQEKERKKDHGGKGRGANLESNVIPNESRERLPGPQVEEIRTTIWVTIYSVSPPLVPSRLFPVTVKTGSP